MEAVDNNVSLVANLVDDYVQNLAGESFAPGAHWKLLGPNDNDICEEEGMREIGGMHLREPTVSQGGYTKGIDEPTK